MRTLHEIITKADTGKKLTISAAQEERLMDIAYMRIKLRGTRATHRALLRNNLIIFDSALGYCLTDSGLYVVEAIRRRRSLTPTKS